MDVKKILFPTDFSGNAEKALPYVNSLAQMYKADVHVLYVIEALAHHDPYYGEFDRKHMDRIHEWEQETAKKRLDEICENHLKGCPMYVKHIAIGDPAEEILKHLKNEKMDMVVMANRGRKARFAFGSVAEKVLKNTPVPVFLVPAV